MENKINKIVTLEDGQKYYILKQAIYKNENYFIVAEVTEDEEDLKEKFNILHETVENGDTYIEFETDPKVIQIILSHLKIEEM
jgi:hypothetical protein